MARHLGLLPGGQLAVGLAQQPLDLALQLLDLVGDVDLAVIGEVPQLFDLAFELGDRLFEVEEVVHGSLSNTAIRAGHVEASARESRASAGCAPPRSEEHTSELQSLM